MNEPIEPLAKGELPVIRELFDELHRRIDETIVNEGAKAIALQHLRAARTQCVLGMNRKA